MVLISKIEVEKQGRGYKDSCGWLGRVSGLFQENKLDNLSKLKAYRKRFYDGAAIATLKSRLKMKPINHQVLIMVFLQKILNNS
jgi:hypothetical protein